MLRWKNRRIHRWVRNTARVKSHEQRGGIKLVMGKDKSKYSFAGRLKALENTTEFSHLFILQLQPLPRGPEPPTLLMTRTSWLVLTLFFCSISWLAIMPHLQISIRRCNLSPKAFGGAAIQALLLSWHYNSESHSDLLIASGPRCNYPSNYVSASQLIRIPKDPFHGCSFVTCYHFCKATVRSWCYVWESNPATCR